nr:hypothetical protein [Microbacterium enclense]
MRANRPEAARERLDGGIDRGLPCEHEVAEEIRAHLVDGAAVVHGIRVVARALGPRDRADRPRLPREAVVHRADLRRSVEDAEPCHAVDVVVDPDTALLLGVGEPLADRNRMKLFDESAGERASARHGVGRCALDHARLECSPCDRVVELDARVADDGGMPRADPSIGERLQRRREVVDDLQRFAEAALDGAVVPAERHSDLGRDRAQRHLAFLHLQRAVLRASERDPHRHREVHHAGRLEFGQRPLALDERGDGVGEDGILPIVEDGRSI